MKVAVAKESYPEERRVALVPSAVKPLIKKGVDVLIESGAGVAAGFADEAYRDAGASVGTRDDVFAGQVARAGPSTLAGSARVRS